MAILYNSNYDETVPFSDVCVQVNLATNTSQSYTVPGTAIDKYSIRFGYTENSNVFVSSNVTGTVPTSGTSNTQQYTEFRPGSDGSQRYAKGGDVLHFITPDATGAYFGISLRQLP